MTTGAELRAMGEQGQMAWVATAGLDDLRWAQSEQLNSLVLLAIQARVRSLEDARRSCRILIVAVLTLIAAFAAAVFAGLSLVAGK